MDPAVLAAAIGGPLVGVAAVVAAEYRSAREGAATVALAEGQRRHERSLRRGERYLEKRGEVYESLLSILFVAMRRFELTEPIIEFDGMPGPPDAPTDEDFFWMQVRLAAWGSPRVSDAFERFGKKSQGFNAAVLTLRLSRQQGGDLTGAYAEVNKYREEARVELEQTKWLVREDLADL